MVGRPVPRDDGATGGVNAGEGLGKKRVETAFAACSGSGFLAPRDRCRASYDGPLRWRPQSIGQACSDRTGQPYCWAASRPTVTAK